MNRCGYAVLALCCVLGLALIACGDRERDRPPSGTGAPRPFEMGLSYLPSELTDESYAEAFQRAADAGEVVLIRRAPPWEELLASDSFPSRQATRETTQREVALIDEHNLDVFVAVDATGIADETGQLAGLPPEAAGADFSDPRLRRAFLTYAQYVTVNYRPKYLALGLEVNRYFAQDPEGFGHFVSLYEEAYDRVKALSPETLIFPAFQMEELAGLLPVDNPLPPQWQLIPRLEAKMDLLAVSSYPGLAFSRPDGIPDDYYTQLAARSSHPIAIVETGYASERSSASGPGGGEADQAAFLRRVLADAQELDITLVVWFLGQDPVFAGEPPLDLVQHIGLLRQDGSAKPAWDIWAEAAARPLEERSS